MFNPTPESGLGFYFAKASKLSIRYIDLSRFLCNNKVVRFLTFEEGIKKKGGRGKMQAKSEKLPRSSVGIIIFLVLALIAALIIIIPALWNQVKWKFIEWSQEIDRVLHSRFYNSGTRDVFFC